jgi:hypothetical protein
MVRLGNAGVVQDIIRLREFDLLKQIRLRVIGGCKQIRSV